MADTGSLSYHRAVAAPSIYLDHQAATPLRDEVVAAMRPFLTHRFADPASAHHLGLEAREAVESARAQVASLIHAESPGCIVFTGSGTEAANLAVKGVAFARQTRGRHIILTQIEHPAVMESALFLERLGFTCTRLPVDAQGRFEPSELAAAITPQTILIAIHLANHDLGSIQPVAEAARIAQDRGIPLFVDAEAATGWTPVHVQALGADLLSFSPHRFYGPRGVGALYCRRGVRPESLIHGGLQEDGRRAGPLDVAGIVGFGVAAEIAQRELPERLIHTRKLQDLLWAGVGGSVRHLKLNGPSPGPQRLATQLNLSAEFTEGEGILLMLDMQGIQIASGAACLGRSSRIPPALKAIGVPPELAVSNILVSWGLTNTEEEIQRFIEVYSRAVAKLRALSPAWEEFQAGLIASVLPD